MTVLTQVLISLYAVGGLMGLTLGMVAWDEAQALSASAEQRRAAARFLLCLPVWPLWVAWWAARRAGNVGRALAALVMDATRDVDR